MFNGPRFERETKMEIKSGLRAEKDDGNDEGSGSGHKRDPLDDRMRISTITALARAIHEQSIGQRSFRPRNIGGSPQIHSPSFQIYLDQSKSKFQVVLISPNFRLLYAYLPSF